MKSFRIQSRRESTRLSKIFGIVIVVTLACVSARAVNLESLYTSQINQPTTKPAKKAAKPCPPSAAKAHDPKVVAQSNAADIAAKLADSPAVPANDTDWGGSCHNFIAGAGKYGDLGHIAALHINRELTPNLLNEGGTDIQKICPSYTNPKIWSDERKAALIVWTISAVAYAESTCGLNKGSPKGVEGVSKGETTGGILQLTRKRENQKVCGSNCLIGDADSERRSVICTVTVLECEVAKNHHIFDPDDEQWSNLRNHDKALETCERIAQFPGCNPDACKEAIGFTSGHKKHPVARR